MNWRSMEIRCNIPFKTDFGFVNTQRSEECVQMPNVKGAWSQEREVGNDIDAVIHYMCFVGVSITNACQSPSKRYWPTFSDAFLP